MLIRKSTESDIDKILGIYSKAREFMALNKNVSQWGNGYPTQQLILDDISKSNSYVCVDDDIIATFCFFIGNEPTYDKIYNGQWLNNNEYAVIHRVAVLSGGHGVGSYCVQWCLSQYKNIRIDTHKDNIPMQKTILKNGFKYCGEIHKEDGTTRLAYQSVL